MGAKASKGPGDIAAKTLEARRIAQEIFRFMVTRMQYPEYLKLANPDQCRDYIFLISESLDKYFTKVKILPGQTKDGFIYFRKFDKTTGASPESQKICRALALFFVRIFQIYGALTISIFDTNTSIYDQGFIGGGDEEDNLIEDLDDNGDLMPLQSGGLPPLITEEPLQATDRLQGDFNELRPYLTRISGNNDLFKMRGYNIFINMSPVGGVGGTYYVIKYQYVRNVGVRGDSLGLIEANMKVEKKEKTLNIYLSNIKVRGLKYKIADSHFFFRKTGDVISTWMASGKDIPGKFQSQFESIINQTDEDYDDDDDDNRRGFRRPEDRRRDNKYQEAKVPEPLRTFKLLERIKSIDTHPIKAHCVARALQLVSAKGLQRETPGLIVSSVCDSKFYSKDDKRFTESLPRMGEPIVDERGLYTLWQLFFDHILSDLSPDMKADTKMKYQRASMILSKIFQNPSPQPFKDIRSYAGSKFCQGKKDQALIVRKKQTIQTLRDITANMLQVQLTHTANAVLLLKKLFVIQPGKPILLHPNLLAGGIPAVNAIADEARTLLLQYYARCESLYAVGVEEIKKGNPEIPRGLF